VVIRVNSLPDLLESMKFISIAGLPKDDGLTVFTCTGGAGLMTPDLADELGMTLKPHGPDHVGDLKAELQNYGRGNHPHDYDSSLRGHEDLLTKCCGTVMRGDYDAGMLILDYAVDGEASMNACNASVNAIIAACQEHGKLPIVTATLPE